MMLETHRNIDGTRSLPFVSFDGGTREGDPGGGSTGGKKPSKKPAAKKAAAPKKGAKRR